MSPEQLRALPFGAVVHDPEKNSYYRKGRWDTWYPISPVTGERIGQQNAVRSAYMPSFHPQLTDSTAETWRLTTPTAKKAISAQRSGGRVLDRRIADRHE
jgi:hypothetical protein